MEYHNVARTLCNGERVTSTYAETYYNEDYCENVKPKEEITKTTEQYKIISTTDEWKSPSDNLIGILELTPPFTSKISRGIAHEGILAIGNGVLEKERARFIEYMNRLKQENEGAWIHILQYEKNIVAQKVKDINHKIFENKNNILIKEINQFYETTLQELENHLRKEVGNTIISTHAKIVSHLNAEIKGKLEYEKKKLDKVLKKRYDSEVKKIKHYYRLILDNEISRNKKLINQALYERNDALKAFVRQIEAQKMTSTMYVMSTERKKCRIKQFILDNYHSTETAAMVQKIKNRQGIIDAFKERDKDLSDINKECEAKIKNVLVLFLKFISLSLKLLPEQATFLLDLEKMVVLQLNEIQKTPTKKASILIDEEEINTFKFEKAKKKETVCDQDPFVIIGDTSAKVNTPHGSRETLASNVDLPMIRLQRQFVYAKCDKFDEVKALLEAQRCKCMDAQTTPILPHESKKSSSPTVTKVPTPAESESSIEPLLMDDIEILHQCPVRRCQDWAKRYSFPNLNNYLDFSEDNYRRVTTILGKLPAADVMPAIINPRDIVYQELPFATTHEKSHTVGTQYSSQEDITFIPCPCVEEFTAELNDSPTEIKKKASITREIDKLLMVKRKASLEQVVSDNPNLLKMFTDESFDFIYTIK